MAHNKKQNRDDVRTELDDSGGKNSWEQTVESMPSGKKRDPKEHEDQRGDLSIRNGDRGDIAGRQEY